MTDAAARAEQVVSEWEDTMRAAGGSVVPWEGQRYILIKRVTAAIEQAVREDREALRIYSSAYRRLMEQSAQGKLDSDVWYLLTKAYNMTKGER